MKKFKHSEKSKEIINQAGSYTFSFLVTQLVSVVGGFLMRHFLGPLQTGVWSLMQVVLSYVDYSTLGATYAISVEIPLRRGQGKEVEVTRLKDVMMSFSFLMSFLTALGVLAYAFILKSSLSQEIFFGLIITAALVVLQQLNNVLISLLRAYKQFELAGKQMMISSVVNLILLSLLSHWFRLYGFMIAMTLSFIFNILFIYFHQPMSFRWNLNRIDLFSLIRFGFPLMFLTLLSTLFLTIDRIMVARFLGMESLGYYSIALMTSGFVFSFPNSIGIVMIPNVSEKFGETSNMADLKGYLEKSNLFFGNMMPFLVGAAWFAVPLAISILIPKFNPGIEAMKYLVLGAFFLAAAQPYLNFIVVVKKHILLAPIASLSCIFSIGAIFLSVRAGMGIEGVAMATAASLFLNFTLFYFFVSRYVFSRREILGEYGWLLIKFVLMFFMLLVVDQNIKTGSFWTTSLLKLFAYILILSPLLFEVEKKLSLWEAVGHKFFRKSLRVTT